MTTTAVSRRPPTPRRSPSRSPRTRARIRSRRRPTSRATTTVAGAAAVRRQRLEPRLRPRQADQVPRGRTPSGCASGRGCSGSSRQIGVVKKYIAKLHPVTLTRDTQVTNHAYTNGQAVPFQAILQAGTAVLVDEYGVPVVRCYCGNPLGPADLHARGRVHGLPADYKPPKQCKFDAARQATTRPTTARPTTRTATTTRCSSRRAVRAAYAELLQGVSGPPGGDGRQRLPTAARAGACARARTRAGPGAGARADGPAVRPAALAARGRAVRRRRSRAPQPSRSPSRRPTRTTTAPTSRRPTRARTTCELRLELRSRAAYDGGRCRRPPSKTPWHDVIEAGRGEQLVRAGPLRRAAG